MGLPRGHDSRARLGHRVQRAGKEEANVVNDTPTQAECSSTRWGSLILHRRMSPANLFAFMENAAAAVRYTC